ARGNDHHFLAARAHPRDILHQRLQPAAVELARFVVGEQGRADLHDDALRVFEMRAHGRQPSSSSVVSVFSSSRRAAIASATRRQTSFAPSPETPEIARTLPPLASCRAASFSSRSSSVSASALLRQRISGFSSSAPP